MYLGPSLASPASFADISTMGVNGVTWRQLSSLPPSCEHVYVRVERVGSALACTGSYGTLQVPPSLLGRVSDAKVLEDLRGQVPPESFLVPPRPPWVLCEVTALATGVERWSVRKVVMAMLV